MCLLQAELFCSICIHCFFPEKHYWTGKTSNLPWKTFHHGSEIPETHAWLGKVSKDIWSREIFITIQCRQESQKSRHWSKNMPLPFPVLHLGLLPLILCTMMTNCLPSMASTQYSWFMIASVLNSLIVVNFYVLIIFFYVFILYYCVDIKNNF
jgi:hypothetical protein